MSITFNQMLPVTTEKLDYLTFLTYLDPDFLIKLNQVGGDNTPAFLSIKFRELNGNRTISELLTDSFYYQRLTEETDGIFSVDKTEIFRQFLQEHTGVFVYKWSKMIENIYLQTYVPLDNYNGIETEINTYEGSENNIHNANNTDVSSTTTSATNSNTDNAQKKAFNSADFVDTDKATANSTGSSTGSQNMTTTETGTDVKSYVNRKDTREFTRHGNLGVTTSQQMLESELAFRAKQDLYPIIIHDLSTLFFDEIY